MGSSQSLPATMLTDRGRLRVDLQAAYALLLGAHSKVSYGRSAAVPPILRGLHSRPRFVA